MERSNYALSIVKGIKPRNQVEAMLAMQMAAIHMASMKASSNLSAAKTGKGVDLWERSLNKLSRTFTTQMEALKRYRSKGGNQRIVVERVNVSEGGQAIVGTSTGGGRVKNSSDNPMNRATALFSHVQALGPLMQGASSARLEGCRFHGARGGAPKGADHGRYVTASLHAKHYSSDRP